MFQKTMLMDMICYKVVFVDDVESPACKYIDSRFVWSYCWCYHFCCIYRIIEIEWCWVMYYVTHLMTYMRMCFEQVGEGFCCWMSEEV